jgi:ribosomal protein S18 acetylase RimI-like enzyme
MESDRQDTAYEILPLRPFTQAELWPILSGYETHEIYSVEKTEADQRTLFDIRLVRLAKPYQTDYYSDFTPDEVDRYLSLLPQGFSFGAYQQDRLVGFAIGEVISEDRLVRVWEFHVLAEFRRAGIGRALMEQVIAKAQQEHLAMVVLETQNTNVDAIRFYRAMGFSLEAIDLSLYFHLSTDSDTTAFFMKQRLTDSPPSTTTIG